jgi:hypothetical protein
MQMFNTANIQFPSKRERGGGGSTALLTQSTYTERYISLLIKEENPHLAATAGIHRQGNHIHVLSEVG